ncbi:MAG: sigma-54-dependent Fis family transcriptional regulator [Thermodesulfovibrionales bacterium]|nr:sigma-54-dependent Fis family transcriptional regulator [Thermodesulfovibrionales bacterium]
MKAKKSRILVVDDERDICRALEFLLSREGYLVETAPSGEKALEKFEKNNYDLVLSDLRMEGMDGLELLDRIKASDPSTIFVIMTAFASVDNAVEAMKKGAEDYIVKPFVNDDVKMSIRRLLNYRSLKRENEILRRELSNRVSNNRFIGDSPQVKEIFAVLEKVMPTKSNILVLGESGTGKGVLAEIIHSNSPRAKKPFLSINCSAIPETLLESELFGYKKGAFTGANSDKVGLIAAADEGTLFLDEIGDMPVALQAKLLKVLEEGVFIRLGDVRPMQVDVRVIAATNKKIEEAVAKGEFREDLYYRLNVIELTIPPLRERTEDIPLLVKHFLGELNRKHSAGIKGVDVHAMDALSSYGWPGNVRELSNMLERAVVMCSSDTIMFEDLPAGKLSASAPAPAEGSLKGSLEYYERKVILEALSAYKRNKEATAKALSIDLGTLYRKMKKLGIAKD